MNIFNYDNRELKKIAKKADKILALENKMKILSNKKLSLKTFEFCKRLSKGETLDDLLVEAFAVCREVAFRTLGKKHYKVQLMGGIAIHQGSVAEMKTGEGKTLTELCPAYLNALTTKGVHIITVNDYLAKRDKEEMEPFFKFLNLSVGLVMEETKNRRFEYRKDIVYTTNNEIGFDYLKDNLVRNRKEKVLRALNYAIIDEIDSILIDEARTPLVISSFAYEYSGIYLKIDRVIKGLKKTDYIIDYKDKTIVLNEQGIKKVEKKLKIENLSDLKLSETNHIIKQSLRANYILKRDKDYILKNGEVILIDENTGRISIGKRLSNGLHQCLEAKELVEIRSENKTVATITYKNFFELYRKISGMSGTIKTEKLEFREIYDLDVIEIPTNKETRRIDKEDLIYKTKILRDKIIIEDIIKTNKIGRPILIATLSIKESEEISKYLNALEIKHNLLNPKNKEEEAEIISKAGEPYAITISTNMAGRGTDIKISDEINRLGGIKVIGVGKSENIRVNNQLIGRAGRQGNNGSSQFYLSLEDDLFSKNKKKNINKIYDGIRGKVIRKEVFNIQKIIASKDYESRKENAKYDEIINIHRKMIYRERDLVVFGRDIRLTITNAIVNINYNLIRTIMGKNKISNLDELNFFEKRKFLNELIKIFEEKYNYSFNIYITNLKEIEFNNLDKITSFFSDIIIEYFNNLLISGIIDFDYHIKDNLLTIINDNWVSHLSEMELLRQRTRNEIFNQKNPFQVYSKESKILYDKLVNNITNDFIEGIFKIIIPSLDRKQINY